MSSCLPVCTFVIIVNCVQTVKSHSCQKKTNRVNFSILCLFGLVPFNSKKKMEFETEQFLYHSSIKEEIVESSSNPQNDDSNSQIDGINCNPFEPLELEQPLLSQSERNQMQIVEDENLIAAVQKFPIIFDRTNSNYQNKEQMRVVWSIIGENLNRSRKWILFHFFRWSAIFTFYFVAADYCQKRWRYLRDYFGRQLRFHRSTDPKKLKRPWILFNKLTFLIPFVAHLPEKCNFESNFNETTTPLAFQMLAYYENNGTEANNSAFDSNTDTIPEDDSDVSHQTSLLQLQYGNPSYSKKRKKDPVNGNKMGLPAANQRKPFETVPRPDTGLDEHEHFLYSLLPELRKIDSKFNLHFRNEIHNLILKYQTMSSSSTLPNSQ